MDTETMQTAAPETDEDDFDVDVSDVSELETDDDDDAESSEPDTKPETEPETEDEPANSDAPTDKPDSDAPPEEETNPVMYDLKYNGEKKLVTVDEMKTLAQKGLNYDKVSQERDALRQESTELRKFRDDNHELLGVLTTAAQNSGMDVPAFVRTIRENLLTSQGVDREVARERIAREDAERQLAAAREQETSGKRKETEEQERRRQDAEAFGKLYQDVDPKTIPDEVWEEVRKGESLVTAYGRYENRQLQAEIKRLKEQQTAAEQNNKNREKTLGSVKTGGQTAAKDPFLEAFLSE